MVKHGPNGHCLGATHHGQGDFTFHPKTEYICEDLSIDPSLFPCSRAADHTFSGPILICAGSRQIYVTGTATGDGSLLRPPTALCPESAAKHQKLNNIWQY